MSDSISYARTIRSFVIRQGRVTVAQERALHELWPQYGIDFSAQPLQLERIFKRTAPRSVEIGFGNGRNLLQLAQQHPERDYLGIEVHRAGVGQLMLGAQQAKLHNLKVIMHDAVEVLREQLVAESLDEILILFPDPWPKKRHQKRRLINSTNVELLASRLRIGGVLKLATDWQNYAEQMLRELTAYATLRNRAIDGLFCARSESRALTRFERRGAALGHDIWDLEFERYR
jgi:tRNA (guanine-N7-)-methyltransferase